jgi:hypothetical protein
MSKKALSRCHQIDKIVSDALEEAIKADHTDMTKILVNNWDDWCSLPYSWPLPERNLPGSRIEYEAFCICVRVGSIHQAEWPISEIKEKNLTDNFVADTLRSKSFDNLAYRHWTWIAMCLRQIPHLAQESRQQDTYTSFLQILILGLLNDLPRESTSAVKLNEEDVEHFIRKNTAPHGDPNPMLARILDWAFITFLATLSKEGLADQKQHINDLFHKNGAKNWAEFFRAV